MQTGLIVNRLIMPMNIEPIRHLYFKSYIRIPAKFIFCFWVTKIAYDYFEYRTAWRTRGPCPRFATFHYQSPILPYLPTPYPHYKSYEDYMEIKHFYALKNMVIKMEVTLGDRYFLHFDAPCRQSDNSVDRLLIRGKEHSTSEKSKFYFLNQLAQKQGTVPQGVYQQIRRLRSSQLQAQKTIVPQL